MADDRMKDDLHRDMGSTGEGKDYDKGQQTPGRNPSTGGQQGQGQQGQGGQQGGLREPRDMEDDDDDLDTGKKRGGQDR